MASRYAVIDVGSNTMKLLIAEPAADGTFERVYETARPARLGRGIAERQLRESVIDSALETLGQFAALCRANRVEDIAAVGTSALRDAENRVEFVNRARSAGIPLEVIPGDEEARLSFLAVRRDPQWRPFPHLLVIDIGGGSTEVIFGGPSEVENRVSLPLGAVRLTEAALHSDPPTVLEMAEASRLATDGLQGMAAAAANYKVVGVGGTVANMGRVALGMSRDQVIGDRLHGSRLTQFEVESQIERYASRGLEQRKRILGLDPERADVILGGAIILRQVMQRAEVNEVDVSTRGLRWGLLYDRFGR
jgi:exopolyphosphatase/guanosine-5'-triphosphate,3'-diphosphate pyrophosphatase